MQKVLTAAEMCEVDRLTTEKYGIPSILLMENAARAAARVITEKLGGSVAGKSILVSCGKGNNGGDGAALARNLATNGALVDVIFCGNLEETKGDAKTNLEIIKAIGEDFDKIYDLITHDLFHKCVFSSGGAINFKEAKTSDDIEKFFYVDMPENRYYDVIVDALFGTGLTHSVKEVYQTAIEFFSKFQESKFFIAQEKSQKSHITVAIDLPSGLNADSAEPIGENIKADLTVTFTAPKLANVFPPASNFGGELVVANIGSPRELIDNSPSQIFVAEKQDARNWLEKTKVKTDSYKKTRGTALIIAGSKNYAGAACSAANACFAAGAGMVSLGVPESIREIVAAKVSEEIIMRGFSQTKNGAFSKSAAKDVLELSEKMNVVALGCGLTSGDESTRAFVCETVENRKTPMVLDADGLNALAPFELQGSDDLPLVLTPHIGEFQRLVGTKDEIKNRIEAAREFSQKHRVILLLKGERSICAAPDGRVVINSTGNAGISRAGAGDTLTGIITSFLAQTYGAEKPNVENTFQTVVAALYVSGLAGDLAAQKFGQRLMTASDIRDFLGEAIRLITN